LYKDVLGEAMTLRLQRKILPGLQWNQEVFGKRILENLHPGVRWLDLGCGKRLLCGGLERLEIELARYPFVGLDLCKENLLAQRSTKQLVLADANFLPFRDESFDLITSNMVIEHMREPKLAFHEMYRVLAPGGTILLHTPNLANYQVFANRVLSKVMPRNLHAFLVWASEKRHAEDIYPTFYRANTKSHLDHLTDGLEAKVSIDYMPACRPFFHYFVPVALVELGITRLTTLKTFRQFATTMLISTQKPGAVSLRQLKEVSRRVNVGAA
jgi:ubiquinone/menaquinone biosynthesis C-methylase UbiE